MFLMKIILICIVNVLQLTIIIYSCVVHFLLILTITIFQPGNTACCNGGVVSVAYVLPRLNNKLYLN